MPDRGQIQTECGYNTRVYNVYDLDSPETEAVVGLRLDRAALLRHLPAVGQILDRPSFHELARCFGREPLKRELQKTLARIRNQIQDGSLSSVSQLEERLEVLSRELRERLASAQKPSLRPLINATGILIHTNLGRAPLPVEAAHSMLELATGYSNLEYRVDEGHRGHRDQHFEDRVRSLLSCEAATVCNNNAAAVFLILNTLAQGKEVLVSRGELVEIGGSFRIPAILAKSGARLREVGTTNKTHLSDYAEAIGEETGLILKVHASNYRIVGFTATPRLGELVELAGRARLPLVEDAGSGNLFSSDHVALRREPAVANSLSQGVDLVSFSGDKLLGGPQAGIIVGRKRLVDRIRKNPLMRVVRVDKMTYAALEHLLIQVLRDENAPSTPIGHMLNTSVEELEQRCEVLQSGLADLGWETEKVSTLALVGGGSAPEEAIPSVGLAIRSQSYSPDRLHQALRKGSVGLVGRIENDLLLLDLRSVLPEQDPKIVQAFRELAELLPESPGKEMA